MKRKKQLSLLLCVSMLLGLTGICSAAQETQTVSEPNREEKVILLEADEAEAEEIELSSEEYEEAVVLSENETLSESVGESAEESGEETGKEEEETEELPDACITVPKNAHLFVGKKERNAHFVRFTEQEAVKTIENGDTASYYYELTDKTDYNYRVYGDEYVTYGGVFKKNADFSLTIPEGKLLPDGKTKETVDRNLSSNNGYNVGDIFLNINPKGYLTLSKGDTFQIVSLRNWEAVDSITNNYFIEPDYHFTVLDENGTVCGDVVSADENGLLTANGDGTAIVLVRYDAMTLNFGKKDEFYGATFPENTGVFVVSVGEAKSTLCDGMTVCDGLNNAEMKLSGDAIDSELDCVYFVGEKGEFRFTPQSEDVTLSVAHPDFLSGNAEYHGFTELSENDDGSYSIPLVTGRNIVKAEKDGETDYRIITAKEVRYTVNGGKEVYAGDPISVVFDTLYAPVGKLAGVYNSSAVAVYTDVSGYDGKLIGGTGAQYNFASNVKAQTVSNVLTEKNVWGAINYVKASDLVVPEDYDSDKFTLRGGCIYTSGWGDPYGNHRGISYETGKAPNLNAQAKRGFFGVLPDIEITVTASNTALVKITAQYDNVKTEYIEGETFDPTGLTVTAEFEDGKTQTVSEYTIEPSVLSADTEFVTVTYKNVWTEIPVKVRKPYASDIRIVTMPNKTEYVEGDAFNPNGMTVEAILENGTTEETLDYTFSPNRALTAEDTEITVTYTGKTVEEKTLSVTVPVTVKEKTQESGGSTFFNTITVYFTLLGDELHGEPTGQDDTHTLRSNNLTTWIPRTKLTLDKGSNVLAAVEKALGISGIPFVNEGNYISIVKGLGEKDNGELSGWMYTINDQHPNLGVEEKILSNRDEIVFHYTDDYTAEKTDFSQVGKPVGDDKPKPGPSTKDPVVSTKDDPDSDEKEEETNVPDDTAKFDESTYSDVSGEDWYFDSVRYVTEKSLMDGNGKEFLPKEKTGRAVFVTSLWKLAGCPDGDKEISFTDELSDDEQKAVRWAYSVGIVKGLTETCFGAQQELTREQAAVLLYRYAVLNGTAASADIEENAFADIGDIADYAKTAVSYAAQKGWINGRGSGYMCPKSSLLRAEAAAILQRCFAE